MQTTSIPIQFLNRYRPADDKVWHSTDDMSNTSWQGLHPWSWRNNDQIEELIGTPTYTDPGSTDSTLALAVNKLSNPGQQQAKNTPNKVQHRHRRAQDSSSLIRNIQRPVISKTPVYAFNKMRSLTNNNSQLSWNLQDIQPQIPHALQKLHLVT